MAIHSSAFLDRENFGRTAMQLPAETVYAQMIYQIGALKTLAESEGERAGARYAL